jgi:hypothetical protein
VSVAGAVMDQRLRVVRIERSPGLAGKTNVAVTLRIRTEELGNTEFQVHVIDRGSEKLNLEEARGALLRFAEKLASALRQPLSPP